jgi:hypothetical protein
MPPRQNSGCSAKAIQPCMAYARTTEAAASAAIPSRTARRAPQRSQTRPATKACASAWNRPRPASGRPTVATFHGKRSSPKSTQIVAPICATKSSTRSVPISAATPLNWSAQRIGANGLRDEAASIRTALRGSMSRKKTSTRLAAFKTAAAKKGARIQL